jgi:ABC-type Na+ efflux pump permease subunit
VNFAVIRALVFLRLLRIIKDRMGVVWLLVMPMFFSFLMGQLLGDWSHSPGELPRFMVYDMDGGASADSLLAPLAGNDKFRVVRSDSAVSEATALDAIERSRITAALFIPDGFSNAESGVDSLRLFYNSDRLSSQTVRTELERAIMKGNTIRAAESLVWHDQAQPVPVDRALSFDQERFASQWADPRVSIVATTLGRAEEKGLTLTDASQHVGPSYTIFFILMFLLMSAKDLVAERNDRTLARLVVSRASALDLVLGFFLGGLIVGLIQGSILLALNSLVFGIDYGSSTAGLVLVLLLVAGVSSAASVLLGCVARSEAQADGLGMAFTMVLAALGGLWWPLEIVPEFMQTLGKSIPTGQAITVFHDMIGRGYGVPELANLFIGLAIWFVVLMTVATWRLRKLVT